MREEVGRDFLVGCRYLGSEDILGEDGRVGGNTLEDAQAIGVALARAGLDFLSISRGGKFEDAQQPAGGRSRLPLHGPQRPDVHPARQEGPAGGERPPRRRASATRCGRPGFAIPVVTAGKIHTFAQAEAILRDGQADLVGMARALLADPDLPRKWRAGADDAAAGLRLLPLLRGRGPAPPRRHLHALAKGPRPPPRASHPRGLDLS